MGEERRYQGSSGTPITYPRATRKTTEETSRSRQTAASKPVSSVVDDDENEDAWIVPKSHSSAYRYDSPSRSPRNATRDMGNPKRTRLVKQRRFDRYTLMIIVGLALIVMIGGWLLFSLIANWWTNTTGDWKYGNPQHAELDHNYGITTASDPKIPVSLLFRPTGNGKWAMYVVVGDSTPYTVEYVSDVQKFVPASS